MEKRLEEMLDQCDVQEVDDLLEKKVGMNLEIDKKALERMKHSVHQKIGRKKKKTRFLMKGIAVAAAFLLILSIVFDLGFSDFVMAITQPFRLVPGYGIVEEGQDERGSEILYILSTPVADENEKAVFTLNNAIASKDTITIMAKLKKKQPQGLPVDKEMRGGDQQMPEISLYCNEEKYSTIDRSAAGGGDEQSVTFAYVLDATLIDTKTTYRLVAEDFGLAVDFTLTYVEGYVSLSDIGSTECKNDISITAVPQFDGNQLTVDLYPMNKSRYPIDAFFRPDNGYAGKDLHLETSGGRRPYVLPDGYGSGHGNFVFNLEPEDQNLVLHIPFLIVQSVEQQGVKLPVPKEGQRLNEEYRLKFKDADLIISGLEKVTDEDHPYGQLKMDLRYEERSEKIKMISTNIYRTNIFGEIDGGGYMLEPDENGITRTLWFALEKGENHKLRLRFGHPTYYLLDEYTLPLSRP